MGLKRPPAEKKHSNFISAKRDSEAHTFNAQSRKNGARSLAWTFNSKTGERSKRSLPRKFKFLSRRSQAGRLQREDDPNRRGLSRLGRQDFQLAVMRLDDFLADGQAQTKADIARGEKR